MTSKTAKVFVAATRQNDGKTFVSLGLFNALSQAFKRSTYMKPVGQEFRMIENKKIDKDAVLFKSTYALLHSHYNDMSPIAVPPGFTKNYILNPDPDRLRHKIKSSYERLASDNDFILIEGTGHAGVGSVFDCNNAEVAHMLGAKVILVSLGGVGRSIDEIMLNLSLFRQANVEVIGVILNQIRADKMEALKPIVEKSLARIGVPILGHIPLNEAILKPSVQQVIESIKPQFLSEQPKENTTIQHFIVGDMVPHEALDRIEDHTMVIVPGNRDGLILTLLCEHLFYGSSRTLLSGFIFTDDIRPHQKVLALLNQTNIPLLLVKEDTYTVSKALNEMTFKLNKDENNKIDAAKSMVKKHVNIDQIIKEIQC